MCRNGAIMIEQADKQDTPTTRQSILIPRQPHLLPVDGVALTLAVYNELFRCGMVRLIHPKDETAIFHQLLRKLLNIVQAEEKFGICVDVDGIDIDTLQTALDEHTARQKIDCVIMQEEVPIGNLQPTTDRLAKAIAAVIAKR